MSSTISTNSHRGRTTATSNHVGAFLTRRLAMLLALGLTATLSAHAQFNDIGAAIPGVHHGAVAWGDYDNDDDLDVLVTGQTQAGPYLSEIYNNNAGTFTAISAGLPGVAVGTGKCGASWVDFDSDNDLDVFITGMKSNATKIAELYENVGGTFSLVTILPTALPGVILSSVAWADYDNDGDPDLFMEGYIGPGFHVSDIYRNDGAGIGGWTFTQVAGTPFTKVSWGAAAWADYDNDQDMDLVVTGYKLTGAAPNSQLYKNNNGVFVPVNPGFVDVGASAVAWGDYDNDDDLDLALMGINSVGNRVLGVYRNNANGTFSAILSTFGYSEGSLAWGDYDNDGDLDLLFTGEDPSGPYSEILDGDGTGGFTAGPSFTGVEQGNATWGDYDNDGKLDVLLAGEVSLSTIVTKVYRNVMAITPNAAPSVPTGLSVSTSPISALLTWNASTDAVTPQDNLHYNFYLYDVTAGQYVQAPSSNPTNGYRMLPELGNANLNEQWEIGNLTPGHTYTACVQAVDGAYKGSAFGCTSQFTLPTSNGPDVMIGDCFADVGSEPNGACGSVMWNSPYIWVRNTNDNLPGHQSPLGGVTNYVYVEVENIGLGALPAGTVQVYFAKASTGLGWPLSWINNYIGGVQYGNYVGSAQITALGAGNSTTVEVQWDNVPDPSDYNDPDAHHFCLLARFVAASDPISTPEVVSVWDNTYNNNNIAWKNVSIIDIDGPQMAPIEIANPSTRNQVMTLRFQHEAGDDYFMRHGRIVVDLGEAGYAKWRDGGMEGEGIRPLNDHDDNTKILLTARDAWIGGLAFLKREQITAHVEFSAEYNADLAGRTFLWHIVQYVQDQDVPLGGKTYEITMPTERGRGKWSAPELGDAAEGGYKLDARPNPTSGASTISYTLPTESRVTLAIYDASGRLVRTLVEGEQAKGAHEVEWNGLSSGGAQVPAGTYFYRLESEGKSVERKIVIVR